MPDQSCQTETTQSFGTQTEEPNQSRVGYGEKFKELVVGGLEKYFYHHGKFVAR